MILVVYVPKGQADFIMLGFVSALYLSFAANLFVRASDQCHRTVLSVMIWDLKEMDPTFNYIRMKQRTSTDKQTNQPMNKLIDQSSKPGL